MHAGNQEKHIRREVPYGKINWMLPIEFTKTETGGNCDVGCHKPKPYDRQNPVKYEEEQSGRSQNSEGKKIEIQSTVVIPWSTVKN